MQDRTSELMGLLRALLIEVSNAQIAEIIGAAREEACAEATGIMKEMMLQAMLESALTELRNQSRLGEVPAAVRPARGRRPLDGETRRPAEEHPGPAGLEAPGPTQEQEQIRQEIEATRRKIAKNQQLLSQTKAAVLKPAEAPAQASAPGESNEADQLKDGIDYGVIPGQASAPGESNEADCGYYVYGVVDGASSIEGLPENGIDAAHPVYTLPRQASATPQAIVSQVSLQEFGQEQLQARLEDIAWLKSRVQVHQSVLASVSDVRTVIPMRFCTIYRSESGVQAMLTQNQVQFVAALARLDGKQEWGVKVHCDTDILAQRVKEISGPVQAMQAEMAAKSSGAAYFMQKKLEEVIAGEVERLGDEYAQRSHDCLGRHAAEAVVNPLQGQDLTGRQEPMLLNGAYLVSRQNLAAFRADLANLQSEYGELGLSYEMVGPWPPYNFVALELEEGAAHD
jgi:hypothetical protein